MRRTNAPTLQDIAREAGVTAMTVSAVLNGSRSGTRVSEATRVRVSEVAARLRYRPNGVARGLSRRCMDTLGVVTTIDGGEAHDGSQINLYFLELLNGVLDAAAQHGQNTTIFSVKDWQDDERRMLNFCDGRVDGVILIAPSLTAGFAESLHHHAPYVTIHGSGVLSHADNLDVDNVEGARTALRHLIAQGHRRIAHFTGALGQLDSQQRLDGYRSALQEAGLPLDDRLVWPGEFNIPTGRDRMARMIDEGCGGLRPTAVFCASDAIAFGCMEALADHGLRVPEDVSIVGFDDVLLSRMSSPALTTVRQPFRHMGRRAVELLLAHVRHEVDSTPDANALAPAACPRTELCPLELVVRGSTGPASAPPVPAPAAGPA